jgi:tetratricopeptide (TPR) repeat protein
MSYGHTSPDSHSKEKNYFQPAVRALLVAVCLMLLLITSACKKDPKVEADKHFQRAQQFLKDSKKDEALIEFRRVLQYQPKMASAHFEIAKLQLERGSVNSAYQELMLSLKYNPEDREANVWMAEFMLRAKDYDAALDRAGLILSKWPDEKRAQLINAEALAGKGKRQESRKAIEEYIQQNPNDARALFDLAALQYLNKSTEFAAAMASMRRAWELSPESLTVPMALSAAYEGEKDFGQAESVLKELVNKQPKRYDVYAMLGMFYVRQKRSSDAEEAFRKAQALGQNEAQHAVLARYYAVSGRTADAIAEYKRVLEQHKDDIGVWRQLAELYFDQGDHASAKQVLDHLMKDNSKDWQTMALRGRMELDEGNIDQALVYLQDSQKANSDYPTTSFFIAQAYIRQGKIDQAKGTLSDLLKKHNDYLPARVMLGELDLRSGKVDEALDQLSQAVTQSPKAPAANLLLSQAMMAKGDFAQAESKLTEQLTLPGPSVTREMMLRTLAMIKIRQGRFAEATKMATEAADLQPQARESLYILGLSYLAQKQPDKALQAVSAYVNKKPDWAEGQELLGRLALQGGKAAQAQKYFENTLKLNPKLTTASYGLSESYIAQNNFDGAKGVLEQMTQLQPENSAAKIRLAQLYERDSDWNKAIAGYEAALKTDSKNALAKNNLAWLYSQHSGNLDVALKLAQEAKEAYPEDAHISDTLGWILVQKGAYDSAIQHLTLAVGKTPADPSYRYHLGLAYLKSGQIPRAKENLQAALKVPNFDQAGEVRKLLATIPN